MRKEKFEVGFICGILGLILFFLALTVVWSIADAFNHYAMWKLLARSGGAIQLITFIAGFVCGFCFGYFKHK